MNALLLQQAGIIGTPEIVLIVLAIVLLFGGRKIPELMRGIGKGVKEFKNGLDVGDEQANSEEKDKTTDKK